MASIKDLVLRVEMYLKWQMYHAQNIYPYPEAQTVAEWVREEGEPNGFVRFGQEGPEPPAPEPEPAPAPAAPAADPAAPAAPAAPEPRKLPKKLSI